MPINKTCYHHEEQKLGTDIVAVQGVEDGVEADMQAEGKTPLSASLAKGSILLAIE